MTIRSINNTFNRGELDPTLMARDDLDLYDKGARKIRNMIALWTGAARLAAGTTYTDVILDREDANAPIQDAVFVKGFDFTFDAQGEIIYTIIIRKSQTKIALDIYYNNTLQDTLTPATDAVLGNYLATQIQEIHFAMAHDRVLLLHENIQFAELRREGSHSSWSVSLLTPRVFPTYDFSLLGTVAQGGAVNYQATVFGLGVGWNVLGGTSVITAVGNAPFTFNHKGGLFIATSGGVGRITAVASTSVATLSILAVFTKQTGHLGSESSLREKIWNTETAIAPASLNRGWPARGSFYLARLILGRSLRLKNVVNISTEGVFDNFDDSDLDPTVAFSASMNGNGEQSVQSIIADDSILFTTTNKLFAQNPLVESPLTIENAYFAPQGQSAASNIEAVTIDNQIMFVSSNKTEVVQAAYTTADGRYITQPATMLSNSLVNTINSNATWEPPNVATRLYLATQDDGSMLLLSTLKSQAVSAWSLRTTTGKFRQVIGAGKQSHVVVEREINTNTLFDETLDFVFLSDPSFGARYDVTEFFESPTVTSTVAVLESLDDYILIGNQAPFTAIDIDLDTVASADCDLQFEYLDGNGFWDVFTPTDNTVGLTISDTITWTFDDVNNWAPFKDNDIENKYWMRIRRREATVATVPVVGHVETNTSARLYLERHSFDEYMDSIVTTTSDANGLVTGLVHLAGQQVYAIVNGATVGSSFVDDAGETTVKALSANVKIGMQFKPELVPMPIYAPTQTGDSLYAEKYVQDLYIDFVDSLYLQAGFRPQLTDIPNMPIGNYTLGASVPPQTGVYRICPRGDWQPRQEYVITQSQPGPMTIIGIGYNLEVS